MALYLISYDIKTYDKDEYPALYEKLEEIEAERILFSEWIVVDEVGKATSIYDEIAPCVKLDDRLLVQELTKDVQWDKLIMSDARFRQFLAHERGFEPFRLFGISHPVGTEIGSGGSQSSVSRTAASQDWLICDLPTIECPRTFFLTTYRK